VFQGLEIVMIEAVGANDIFDSLLCSALALINVKITTGLSDK